MTRQRSTLIRERASVINRLQKVLEWANLKLASVVSDIGGVSGRAMLKALVAGTGDPQALADLAKGRMCLKQAELVEALSGRVRDHHRFLIQTHLAHLEFLDAQLKSFDQRIEQLIEQHTVASGAPVATSDAAMQTETPDRHSAELLLAEIGSDMRRFPSAVHLCK